MTAIYHPQKMESERLLTAYKLAGVEPPTPEQERHLADLWREVAIKSGTAYMPNAESEPDMWLFHMGKRLAGYMKKVGIQNDFVINQIRDATLNRTRTNGMIGNEDYPFDILKSSLLNREEMKAYMTAKGMKERYAEPGSVTLTKSDPVIAERAQKLDDALDAILREMDYKDSDHTLARNVFRQYGAAVSTKVVQHPDYVQLKVETAYREEIARMQKGPQQVTDEDLTRETDATPMSAEEKTGKPLLQEYFPRGKADESVSPDEPMPKENEWANFWQSAKRQIKRLELDWCDDDKEIHSWVHRHFQVESMKDAKVASRSKGDLLNEIKAQIDLLLEARAEQAKSDADEKAPETKVEKSAETSTSTGVILSANVETPEKPISQNGVEKSKPEEFEAAKILDEIKTLGGVPLSKLHHTMNRKFAKQYYKAIKAKDGTKGDDGSDKGWTDIDPVGVRKRMDKVFGPQGFGWRIVPMQGIGQVIDDGVEIQHVKEFVKDGKVVKAAYDRQLHSVSMQCFVFEYALIQDGKIHYIQTSAFSCTCQMDERDDAYKGAFTGIMKMALKYFSGYDHFMDKAA